MHLKMSSARMAAIFFQGEMSQLLYWINFAWVKNAIWHRPKWVKLIQQIRGHLMKYLISFAYMYWCTFIATW